MSGASPAPRPHSRPSLLSRLGRPRRLAPELRCEGPVGVTLVSPGYEHLAEEAVRRFRVSTGLSVLVLHVEREPSYAAKLNLDLLVAPRPIVFFDVDLWMLRPHEFAPLAGSGRFGAVPDAGAWNPRTFPYADCEREGWDRADYFNSGLLVCDLARPEIRAVFAAARKRLADCHAGRQEAPADYGDQYFLNWAVRQQPGLLRRLPLELNFYKRVVDGGNYPHLPREIIGLHAAGIPLGEKLAALHAQAAVFGEPVLPMCPQAEAHFATLARPAAATNAIEPHLYE